MDIAPLCEAGLTEGEAKVYLALLTTGETTTGPIGKESGVSNSVIYRILDNLIEKGLVSSVVKGKTTYYYPEDPGKILEYIERQERSLQENKQRIKQDMARMRGLLSDSHETSVRVFEGFKGFQTAWESYHRELSENEEYHSWGVYAYQDERYHLYWQRDHERRVREGIKGKILFNADTAKNVVSNRSKYEGMDVRYMPSPIKTPAWFAVFKDTTLIALQKKDVMVKIVDKDIAATFDAYFQELWSQTTPIEKQMPPKTKTTAKSK